MDRCPQLIRQRHGNDLTCLYPVPCLNQRFCRHPHMLLKGDRDLPGGKTPPRTRMRECYTHPAPGG